jgi:hypothetical protein
MKLHFGHICVLVALMLAACVPASAYVYPVDSNDSDEFGDASGSCGDPTYASAGAHASGSDPSSWAWGSGSRSIYTTEDGDFYYSCYVRVGADGSADWAEGSAPFGGGQSGASSGPLSIQADAPCSPSNYGLYYAPHDDGGYPGGDYTYVGPERHFAWECVASMGTGAIAQASAESGSLNEGWGSADAHATLTVY